MGNKRVVIIGAGQAGGDVAAALREREFRGSITLIGDESAHPYSRPPLSKAYLKGEKTESDLLIRASETYERFDIGLRLGERVEAIDRHKSALRTRSGECIKYDDLVIATGGAPRRHPEARVNTARNVLYMRTLADASKMRKWMRPGARLLVIGAGYIGLEAAAAARRLGLEVTVVEREDRVLSRVTSTVVSEFFARVHREAGVTIRTGATINDYSFARDGALQTVNVDGDDIPVDVCLVGIGLSPNTVLAEQAGLAVQNGIVVDSSLQTSAPSIYAIGDVSSYPTGDSGEHRRVESVPNATDQARALARTLTGDPRPYCAVPWFWSDQYDLKFKSVGIAGPQDDVIVRGDPATGSTFVAFYVRDDCVSAADVMSTPRDFAACKQLVSQRIRVDPSSLRESAIPLKGLASVPI